MSCTMVADKPCCINFALLWSMIRSLGLLVCPMHRMRQKVHNDLLTYASLAQQVCIG